MYNPVYMERTNIYLGQDQAAALDQLSQRAGVSRAELVRRLIDSGLGVEASDLESDLRATSESFAVLAGERQRWRRGRDARERHLDRVRGQ
jgi:metal-responsive CopG/Arc/MetJ family transcriptional regulator